MQRKDEILAKKAKLAELRRQREEREQRQKESGKRESLAGEPLEVSCPYYDERVRLQLMTIRGEPLRLHERQTGRSSIASLIRWWEIDQHRGMQELPLRPVERVGKALHLILEGLGRIHTSVHRVGIERLYRLLRLEPRHCRIRPSRLPTNPRQLQQESKVMW